MSKYHAMVASARPLFLIGSPRSGTTFTANLLNSHPEVLMTSETASFILADDVIRKSERGSRAGINYGKQYHALLSGLLADNYRVMQQDFYARIACEQKRGYLSYWGEKHPHLYECLPRIEAAFSDAAYIYVVRDPRDSALSIARMGNVAYPPAIRNWKAFSDAYEAFVAKLVPERVLTIRYEDLVQDYYTAAKKLCTWLDLPLAPQMLEFLHDSRSVDAHASGSRKDFAAQSRGRWQQQLAPDDIALTRTLVGGFMDKHGYTE